MRREMKIGAGIVLVLAALGFGQAALDRVAAEGKSAQAPRFEVDPMWPKPLPNHWLMGNVIGVNVDSKDHIWIINRQGSLELKEINAPKNPRDSAFCLPAPPFLEFDEEGNLLAHWGCQGGEGYEWPGSNHGIFVDY